MTQDMINKVKNCAHCKKYEGAPPIAKLQKLPCSGPGELLHIDFTTIEETVGLHEEPVVRNVLVMQDHFSKHVVAYVVKDQKARTAAKTFSKQIFGIVWSPCIPTQQQREIIHCHSGGRPFVSCMVSRSSEPPLIMLKPMDKWSA